MLADLLFSVERIAPFFLLIALGGFLRMRGMVPEAFFRMANQFVFKIALPCGLFLNIAQPGSISGVRPQLLWYVFAATIAAFCLIWLATELLFQRKEQVGTLVQGAFRGNFVLLGMPIMVALTGASGAQLAAFTVLVAVPLYNVLAVLALSVRSGKPGKFHIGNVFRGLLANPLIIAILLGLPFFFLSIPIPYLAEETLHYMGTCATPLGLLSVGGLFRWKDAVACFRPALYATVIKTVVQPGLLVPLAYALGFRGEELLVLLVLFAAPTAIASFALATAMEGDGPLASNILILTTLLSAPVMAVGVTVLRGLGLLL